MPSMRDRVAIITGASSGIGEATARVLARDGSRVVLVARREERLWTLKHQLDNDSNAAGRALIVKADVTNQADRERIVEQSMRVFGRVDALVNNAGFGQRGPLEMVPIESIRQNFETNLFALVALTQLVIPLLRRQRQGRIVNVGSVAGRIARPFSAVYDSTKHALEAVTDGLRGELALFGLQVCLIQPGFILTEFTQASSEISKPVIDNSGPYGPFVSRFSGVSDRAKRIAGRPEDVAQVILRALTDDRPRFRYAVPRHAQVLLAMKRFLPARVFDQFVLGLMGLRGVKV